MSIASDRMDTTPLRQDHAKTRRVEFLGTPFDRVEFLDVAALIADARADLSFRYIVTPNVDHVTRLAADPSLLVYFDNAWLTLCDSKPIALLGRLFGHVLPRVTGSDLTSHLFANIIVPGDRLTIIASHPTVVDRLKLQFPGVHIRAHVPPMGIRTNLLALQECVDFAVREPSDFVFIAIGFPQSEQIAYAMAQDGRATGTGLCIGASLEFLTGMKQRAPAWMSRIGAEWLHRLVTDPKRLWRRYLLSVGPLMGLLLKEIRRPKD